MQKNAPGSFVLPLIFLHLAIVLPLAFLLNIWMDEASSLYTTQNGFGPAFQNAAADEKQAPLYFWILSLWRLINDSVFFARLFSVICSAAAITAFAGLAQRLMPPRAGLLAAAFFALHPILIWASLEIRVYSLVILLSILLIRLFFEGFWEGSGEGVLGGKRKKQALFFIVAVISLYTNYYLGLLLGGFFASLVVSRKWREARVYFFLMAAAGLVFLPLIVTILEQLASHAAGYQPERYFVDGVRQIWHHAVTHVLPTKFLSDADPSWFPVVRTWTIRVLFAAAAVLAIGKWRRVSRQTIALAAITFSIGALLLFAYFLLGPTYIAMRHVSVLFVPLIIFGASLVSDVSREWSGRSVRITSLAAGLLVLTYFSYSLTSLYPNMTKRGDWARIGAFIEQNERHGQPIVVFTAFESLALPYHYAGVNRVLPDEKFFTFDAEAEFGSANSLLSEIEFVISEIPPEADMVWLAVGEICLKTEACLQLENYVKANYTIEIEKEFYLEKLYLLKRKPR